MRDGWRDESKEMSRRELEGKEGETVIMHWVQRGKKRLQREFRMGGGLLGRGRDRDRGRREAVNTGTDRNETILFSLTVSTNAEMPSFLSELKCQIKTYRWSHSCCRIM